MNKKTQMYVGAAVLVVAGYMIFKKMQDKKKAPVALKSGEDAPPKQFAGMDYNTVVGNRKKMVGMVAGNMVGMVAANKDVQDSDWVRADGASIAPNFFDVQSSEWIRAGLN